MLMPMRGRLFMAESLPLVLGLAESVPASRSARRFGGTAEARSQVSRIREIQIRLDGAGSWETLGLGVTMRGRGWFPVGPNRKGGRPSELVVPFRGPSVQGGWSLAARGRRFQADFQGNPPFSVKIAGDWHDGKQGIRTRPRTAVQKGTCRAGTTPDDEPRRDVLGTPAAPPRIGPRRRSITADALNASRRRGTPALNSHP